VLTPEDLANPLTKSGYRHVRKVGGQPSQPRTGNVYFQAQHMPKSGDHGPGRKTALEAAQDYCDWANGNGVTPAKPLKSAGHKIRRRHLTDDPEVEAALGVLRDARGQRQGNKGYVYCISDGEYLKIGFSTNPQARVAELQTGNARKLTIVGTIEGTLEDEAALHQEFISDNVLAEWFKNTPSIVAKFTK
jgi:Meiotically up-regulated gene 113